MTPSELESYLHEHIPLSRAMAVSVISASKEGVVLQAPLPPNINHRGTLFGGSASAVAILSAWSLLHFRLTAAGQSGRLVIQRNTMDYLLPIEGTFRAQSLADGADWDRFVHILARRGRARLTIGATLHYADKLAGRLTGDFVALTDPD